MSWWESWFGEEYLDLYPHRDVASARREAAFALAHLPSRAQPAAGSLLRLGPPLACRSPRPGSPSVGLDYSAPLLDLARQRDRHLALVRGDMRALPFRDGAFRAVVNFFTSFGYFLTEAENTAVVAEIERVLRGGGAFLCDTFCRDHVLARLVAEERRCCGEKEYRIRRSWNPATARLEKEIEVRRAGSAEIFRESVRAYTADELVALLEGAGLRVETGLGRLRRDARRARFAAPDRARAQAGEALVIPYAKYPGLSPLFLEFLRGAARSLSRPPTLDAAAARGKQLLAAGQRRARPGLGLPMSRRRGADDGRGAGGGPRRRRLGGTPGRASSRGPSSRS